MKIKELTWTTLIKFYYEQQFVQGFMTSDEKDELISELNTTEVINRKSLLTCMLSDKAINQLKQDCLKANR